MKRVKFAKNGFETVMNDDVAKIYANKKVSINGEMVPKVKILGDAKDIDENASGKEKSKDKDAK